MHPKSPKLLDDVRHSCEFIHEYTVSKTIEDYLSDRLMRHAVERNISSVKQSPACDELIPTLLSRLSSLTRSLQYGIDLLTAMKKRSTTRSSGRPYRSRFRRCMRK